MSGLFPSQHFTSSDATLKNHECGHGRFPSGVIATFQHHAVDRNNFYTIIFGHKVVINVKRSGRQMVMVKHNSKREDDERVRSVVMTIVLVVVVEFEKIANSQCTCQPEILIA
jgi:LPS sulfotransferase NodH